jgi:hypothetical protein
MLPIGWRGIPFHFEKGGPSALPRVLLPLGRLLEASFLPPLRLCQRMRASLPLTMLLSLGLPDNLVSAATRDAEDGSGTDNLNPIVDCPAPYERRSSLVSLAAGRLWR